ncbi:MAG: WecB/TagA/CpsF family glycosyltransferase [Thermoguttaceae bacterium]|nr:WecB/TagA/CpsF family glycosyltransferase [Thermoguttaceae bacterium]MDW8036508.1 WecB/TagA/CpsF family glycosyltransferase [Thermoguttaceae bacterium]
MNRILLEHPKGYGSSEGAGQAINLPELEEVEVLGLRLARMSFAQTVDRVEWLIRQGKPSFFITANLHYALLCQQDARLQRVNQKAAFLTADGMPLVWISRLLGQPIPERVTGADLLWALCQRAAQRDYGVFFLGGQPGVAQRAASLLQARYPGLRIVGMEAPLFEQLGRNEHAQLVHRIRQAKPDLLFVALGQPKGELWLAEHIEQLGVPAAVQIGAGLDFVAGRQRRAPGWIRQIGLEWFWRFLCEPGRLGPRYLADGWFLLRHLSKSLWLGKKALRSPEAPRNRALP